MKVYTESEVRAAVLLGVILAIVAMLVLRCVAELLLVAIDMTEAWFKRRNAAPAPAPRRRK